MPWLGVWIGVAYWNAHGRDARRQPRRWRGSQPAETACVAEKAQRLRFLASRPPPLKCRRRAPTSPAEGPSGGVSIYAVIGNEARSRCRSSRPDRARS